jgi:ParB family transcriptional regulator, chromosome partitioning protein
MPSATAAAKASNIIDLQERRIGRLVLRTYRTKVDIDCVVPNERPSRDPRGGDADLQLDIESNQGLAEPLLVEPHPDLPATFRIIDGGRRWASARALVRNGREQYRQIPVEVTDRTLSEDERLRVWIHIQRRQREWDAKEKEMVTYQLVRQIGPAGTASLLELSVKEIERLVAIYELAQRFTAFPEPSAAFVWARELIGVSKKLLTPSVIDAVVTKVNKRRITNSKDLRKLRQILPDPIARKHFLSDAGDIASASLRLPYVEKAAPQASFVDKLDVAMEAMKTLPWSTLSSLKGDKQLLQKLGEAEVLVSSLRRTLQDLDIGHGSTLPPDHATKVDP